MFQFHIDAAAVSLETIPIIVGAAWSRMHRTEPNQRNGKEVVLQPLLHTEVVVGSKE